MSTNSHQVRRLQKRRSRIGLLIVVFLVPLLTGVLACIPVPVGDPEKSQVDPALTGIWVGEDDGSDIAVLVLDPYDKRSWLMSFISMGPPQETQTDEEEQDESVVAGTVTQASLLRELRSGQVEVKRVSLSKSWLTTIEGETFFTWESKTLPQTLPEMVPEYWWVFRLRRESADTFELDSLNFEIGDSDVDEFETSKQAEDFIRSHLEDPKFYSNIKGESLKFHRVPEDDYKIIAGLLSNFGIDGNF